VVGEASSADSPNTVEVRRVIKDEFGGGRNRWDLQCTEYVMYRVYKNSNT